jgi:hypothetical protein
MTTRNTGRLEKDHERLNSKLVPELSFDDRREDERKDVELHLHIGDQKAPVYTSETLIEKLEGPAQSPLHARGLSRFVNDRLFLDAYKEAIRGLGGDPSSKPGKIEVTVRDNLSGESYEITFRAPLPEGVNVPGGEESTAGKDYDFALTLRVPWDEVVRKNPDFTIDAPRIESRPAPINT